MKKATVIVLVLALLVSIFAACQPKTPDNPGENSNKPEGTTAKAPETEPKGNDTTEDKGGETTPKQEEDPNALPTKRTIYSTDTRDLLTLFEHGVDISNLQVINTLNLGKNWVVNGVMDADGKLEADIAEWEVVDTTGAHHLNDGKNKYFPFLGYTKSITINEILLGDVAAWNWERDADGNVIDPFKFEDIGDIEIWYTDNPNGTWKKWEGTTATSFENLDNGILWGGYAQGISITGPDITGSYFLIYDQDPQENEFYTIANFACPSAIYNPPAA